MDQNQTVPPPAPSYDFILSQPGPNGELPGQPPKKSKKKMIIVILLITVIFAAVFLLIFTSRSNTNKQTLVSPEQAAKEQVVEQFLEFLSSGDFVQAYALLSPNATLGEESGMPKDWFVGTVAPAFVDTYNTARCTVSTSSADPSLVVSLCPATDGQTSTLHEYQLSGQQGSQKIERMEIKEIKSND